MFCPRCGQAPNSNAMRFCANCGLRLEGVSQLIANDGVLPNQISETPPTLAPKRRSMRNGARFLFTSLVLFPLFFALCFVTDNPVPLLVPATVFLTGLCWMIYARLFGEDLVPVTKKILPVEQAPRPVYFPPAKVIKTAEIDPPYSVTEHTTRQFGLE